mmetsp:Transcript_55005/g.112379  ORF Transcript_55005/g.112379 Transcript_55005/m.112379 type:complete len:162 (+) Transcript_55005:66-551(+)|eukprot:CAMPEP_0181325644 /NCGR_PEP_ID=MMETSP1101-20121128/21048_1 /TAXON_ID=46948 /ORGANISM="Rhodomonas abbreviata, Strain Caron Lab Isolate" /LENGTH=161 /DNA_ID=CAMNT_0023433991 /DNA_START=53 /DNA_END=538 /DNA_ORIENTATION=+
MSLTPFQLQTATDPWNFVPNLGSNWLLNDPRFEGTVSDTRREMNRELTQMSPLLNADLIEREGDYVVHADLPGVDPEDLDISIHHNCLVMKAERKHTHKVDNDKVHAMERSYGKVSRCLSMPKNADMVNVTTTFKDGVLSIVFPKLANVAPASRKLTINRA